jgi:hypothetical protein
MPYEPPELLLPERLPPDGVGRLLRSGLPLLRPLPALERPAEEVPAAPEELFRLS